MKLQEMIQGLDDLSPEEQVSLFNILEQRLKKEVVNQQDNGELFWQGLLKFRERIEKDGIVFTDDDFADLRDKSPGRELVLVTNNVKDFADFQDLEIYNWFEG